MKVVVYLCNKPICGARSMLAMQLPLPTEQGRPSYGKPGLLYISPLIAVLDALAMAP
jgi:hypothetical protein